MLIRLVSPNRRRIADARTLSIEALTQLQNSGWVPYNGPAGSTTGHTSATAGWVIPGTDTALDKARFAITGTGLLGGKEPVKP